MEIKQSHFCQVKLNLHSEFGIQAVVTLLNDHAGYLTHDVEFIGNLYFRLTGCHCHKTSYDEIRMEIIDHYVYREVVINTSVIGDYGVNHNGAEHERERH